MFSDNILPVQGQIQNNMSQKQGSRQRLAINLVGGQVIPQHTSLHLSHLIILCPRLKLDKSRVSQGNQMLHLSQSPEQINYTETTCQAEAVNGNQLAVAMVIMVRR